MIAGASLSICGLAGLAVRYVLVPYLREHVVVPVQETHRQVTQNRHESNVPTVVDRIDDLREQIDHLGSTIVATQAVANAAARSSSAAHRRVDDHLTWAREEDSRLWRAVSEARHRAEPQDRE